MTDPQQPLKRLAKAVHSHRKAIQAMRQHAEQLEAGRLAERSNAQQEPVPSETIRGQAGDANSDTA